MPLLYLQALHFPHLLFHCPSSPGYFACFFVLRKWKGFYLLDIEVYHPFKKRAITPAVGRSVRYMPEIGS